MPKIFAFAVIALAAVTSGCEGADDDDPPAVSAIGDNDAAEKSELDEHPTILGITPKGQAEIRELIVKDDPRADADKVFATYMKRLRKIAEGHKIKPTAAGDYAFPAELEKGLDQYRGQGAVLESLKILRDFDLDLPGWARSLVNEYETGKITDDREELQTAIVNVELASLLHELSR